MKPLSHILKDGRKLSISELGPEDALDVIGYLNEVGGETDFLTFGKNEFWLSTAEEEAFLRAIHPEVGWMLKGTVDSRLVSSLSLLRTDRPRLKHIAVLGISVREEYCSLGVGRRMCEAGIALARQSGVRKVDLHVRTDNAKAIRLYESLGFQREGEVSRAYLIRGEFFSNLHMGLLLD